MTVLEKERMKAHAEKTRSLKLLNQPTIKSAVNSINHSRKNIILRSDYC